MEASRKWLEEHEDDEIVGSNETTPTAGPVQIGGSDGHRHNTEDKSYFERKGVDRGGSILTDSEDEDQPSASDILLTSSMEQARERKKVTTQFRSILKAICDGDTPQETLNTMKHPPSESDDRSRPLTDLQKIFESSEYEDISHEYCRKMEGFPTVQLDLTVFEDQTLSMVSNVFTRRRMKAHLRTFFNHLVDKLATTDAERGKWNAASEANLRLKEKIDQEHIRATAAEEEVQSKESEIITLNSRLASAYRRLNTQEKQYEEDLQRIKDLAQNYNISPDTLHSPDLDSIKNPPAWRQAVLSTLTSSLDNFALGMRRTMQTFSLKCRTSLDHCEARVSRLEGLRAQSKCVLCVLCVPCAAYVCLHVMTTFFNYCYVVLSYIYAVVLSVCNYHSNFDLQGHTNYFLPHDS